MMRYRLVLLTLTTAVVLITLARFSAPHTVEAHGVPCSAFATQAEAQAHYRADPVGHINLEVILDGDGDGIACEWNPCPCDYEPVNLPSEVRAREAVITEANKGRFSTDAIILAARLTRDPWLSTQTATMLDHDLHRIRADFPPVQNVHAFPDFVLTELLLHLDVDAPWLDAWMGGSLATGDANVDGLLRAAHATGVKHLWLSERNHEHVFKLTFAQPLNIRILSKRVQVASEYFHIANPNAIIGDSDQIAFEQVGDQKRYTFSAGWGDCPAGCISRHYWEFTLLPGGDIHLREYGAPLP